MELETKLHLISADEIIELAKARIRDEYKDDITFIGNCIDDFEVWEEIVSEHFNTDNEKDIKALSRFVNHAYKKICKDLKKAINKAIKKYIGD